MSTEIRPVGTAFDQAYANALPFAQTTNPSLAKTRLRWILTNYATATPDNKTKYQGEAAALSKVHNLEIPTAIRNDLPAVWKDGRAPATPLEGIKKL